MYLCNYFLSKSPSNRILGSTDWQILELSFEIRNGDNYFSWSLPTLDITIISLQNFWAGDMSYLNLQLFHYS